MRLLIVEDEKSLVRALTTILEKSGYSGMPFLMGNLRWNIWKTEVTRA